MQAEPNKEMAELNTFCVNENLLPKGENELLKSAVVFGANASGKSNLIKALRYMRFVVLSSAGQMNNAIKSNEPFAFLDTANNETTQFEIDFIANDVFYNYGFDIQNKKIVKEFLHRRSERLSPVFERQGSEITKLSNTDANFGKLINLSDQTLFLSFAVNLNLPQQMKEDFFAVINWFGNLTPLTEMDMNGFDVYSENKQYLDVALELLKRADIGIDNFQVIKNKLADIADQQRGIPVNIAINPLAPHQLIQEKTGMFSLDLETTFSIYDSKEKVVGEKKVRLDRDYGFHSNGTYRLMCFLGFIIKNLHQGGVVIIDEIDSQLHFMVVDYILKLYNSISSNPKNAQLICTAHSVLLMDGDLRRDQIYFTVKDEKGKSTLNSLSDYSGVKKTDLFSKKYLAGFYSAVPNMRRGK